jgi:hypothetical protein
MKIRIALLFTCVLVSANSGAAQADTMKPLDPDQAPIAAVDRFSDKAATIYMRTADDRLPGHIPGPNEPVDFDTGPFITQGLSPRTGKPVRYYNFDIQSTTPAPVYVLYREGEDKPVVGQLEIIDTLPGEKGYNDFRQVWKVSVPKDYVANTITDADALSQAGYKPERTDTLRNMPVVPDKSIARERLNGESAELRRAWYRGQVAKFFSFNEAPLVGTSVPLSPIYVSFNINPGQPNGGLASDFRIEPNTLQTHNVPATLPGDTAYSPLWLSVAYDNADWPSVHNLDTALKAKVIPTRVLTVNCPIVFIEP